MNRLIATLTIVGLFVVGVTALIILTAPVVVGELAYFIDNFPLYIKRMQGLATDPNRPWLSKLVGEGLAYAEQSVGELTTLATAWLRDFLRSVWTGGRALISAFSLLVVTPIVACYPFMIGRRWWRLSISGYRRRSAIPSVLLLARSTTRSAAL